MNGLWCSESVILSGFVCEAAVDVGFAERSVIYFELTVLCDPPSERAADDANPAQALIFIGWLRAHTCELLIQMDF